MKQGGNERIFHAEDDAKEKLLEWAGKIQALGGIFSALAWHENNNNGATTAIESHGENYGLVIQEYGELIFNTVNEQVQFTDEVPSEKLAVWGEKYEVLKDTKRLEDIYIVDNYLAALDTFIRENALPAFDLKNKFGNIRAKLLAQKIKSAPAANQ